MGKKKKNNSPNRFAQAHKPNYVGLVIITMKKMMLHPDLKVSETV